MVTDCVAPTMAGATQSNSVSTKLLVFLHVHVATQVRELGAELCAQSGGAADDGDRNERSNQAVFDCSSTGFILEETSENLGHRVSPNLCWFSTPTTVLRCSVGFKLQRGDFQALKKND